jgi:acyl-coenzyme A synthetase/AMP-(fatty) acid ligase
VVTAYEFPEKTTDWPDYPPIGENIYNTKILILDEEKRLVPFGATGEIYIGGVCLAKGYINRDDLTAKRFITDPWGDGDYLYKSGDFGKYLPDGNLVFLGRKDEQIKIRGFRIEPKEIEWQLLKFPSIKEAVVIPKSSVFSEKHLEAFLVVNTEKNDSLINEIYTFLQENLPPHMLPSRFNFIEQMPLTSSGKINRKALESYESSVNYTLDNIAPPKTQTEKEVIALLESMFKFKIGISNSFISIGGSSLLAMQAVSMLQKKFLIEMPAHTI